MCNTVYMRPDLSGAADFRNTSCVGIPRPRERNDCPGSQRQQVADNAGTRPQSLLGRRLPPAHLPHCSLYLEFTFVRFTFARPQASYL